MTQNKGARSAILAISYNSDGKAVRIVQIHVCKYGANIKPVSNPLETVALLSNWNLEGLIAARTPFYYRKQKGSEPTSGMVGTVQVERSMSSLIGSLLHQ